MAKSIEGFSKPGKPEPIESELRCGTVPIGKTEIDLERYIRGKTEIIYEDRKYKFLDTSRYDPKKR